MMAPPLGMRWVLGGAGARRLLWNHLGRLARAGVTLDVDDVFTEVGNRPASGSAGFTRNVRGRIAGVLQIIVAPDVRLLGGWLFVGGWRLIGVWGRLK